MTMITEIQSAPAASQGNNPGLTAGNGALFQSLLAAWLIPAETAVFTNPSSTDGTEEMLAFPFAQLAREKSDEDLGVDDQTLSTLVGAEALWMLHTNLGKPVIPAESRAVALAALTMGLAPDVTGSGLPGAAYLPTSQPTVDFMLQPTTDSPNSGDDGAIISPAETKLNPTTIAAMPSLNQTNHPVPNIADSSQVPGELPQHVGEKYQILASPMGNDVQQGSEKGLVLESHPSAPAEEMSPNPGRLDKSASGRLRRDSTPQALDRSSQDTDGHSQKTEGENIPTVHRQQDTENEKGTDPALLLRPEGSVAIEEIIRPGGKGAEHMPQEAAAIGKTAEAGNKVSRADGQGVLPPHIEWENVRDQIIQAGRVIKHEGWKQMDLKLEPESLGKILLQVATKNEIVAVRLLVENQQIGRLLEEHLPQLKQTLNEQGLKLDQVTVQVSTGNHFGAGQQQNFNGAQWYAGYAQSKLNKAASGWMSGGEESGPIQEGNPYQGRQVDYLA